MTWQAWMFMSLWFLSIGIIFMQGASLGRIRDQRNQARESLTHLNPVEEDDEFTVIDPRQREPWEDEMAEQFKAQHTIGHPDWRPPPYERET